MESCQVGNFKGCDKYCKLCYVDLKSIISYMIVEDYIDGELEEIMKNLDKLKTNDTNEFIDGIKYLYTNMYSNRYNIENEFCCKCLKNVTYKKIKSIWRLRCRVCNLCKLPFEKSIQGVDKHSISKDHLATVHPIEKRILRYCCSCEEFVYHSEIDDHRRSPYHKNNPLNLYRKS